MTDDYLLALEQNFAPPDPDEEEDYLKALEANFGFGDGMSAYGGQLPQEEPGLIGRFTGSFQQSLSRGIRGIPGGIGAGYAQATGNEAMFDAQIAELQNITDEVSAYNPNPSSFAEVREKFTAGGLLPAAGEVLDLAAQGIGGSLGYMLPSLALVGVGTLALGSTAVSAPWIAAAALGGAGLTRFAQYFSEQMEETVTYAQQNGEEVDTEDIDLANQLLSAAGQTLVEAVPVGMAGLVKNVAASTVVRNAANTAAARTVMRTADMLDSPSKLVIAARTTGAEIFTEQGQNLMQRAAAGQSLDINDQEAFDSYLETFVSTLLTAGAFGGVAAYNYTDPKAADPKVDPNAEGAQVSTTGDPMIDALAFGQPYQTPVPENGNPFYAPGLAPVTDRQDEQSRLAEAEARLRARAEQRRITGIERTIEDIRAILRDRNVDFEGSTEAQAGLTQLVYDTIGKTRLADATPKELERVYERIANIERFNEPSRLPLATEADSLTFARRLGRRKKPQTKAQLRERILSQLRKDENPYTDPRFYTLRAQAIMDRLEQDGYITGPPGKYKIDIEAVNLATDENIAPVIESIEEIIDEREVGTVKEGLFPSWKEVKEKTGLFNKKIYDRIKDAYLRRGIIEKRDGKYYSKRSLDQLVKEGSPLVTDPEGKKKVKDAKQGVATTTPTRTTYERSNPVRRWIVEDDQGRVVPGGIFRSKEAADNFVKRRENLERPGQPQATLASAFPKYRQPRAQRGFVVQEKQYDGDTVVDTKMVDFFPYEQNAQGLADERVRELMDRQEQNARENRPEFLGGETITSPYQKRIVRQARMAKAKERHKAIQMIMDTPGHVSAVVQRYGLGVDPDSSAVTNVTDSKGETVFGQLPFNQLAQRIGRMFDIVVKEGVLQANGLGFGKARLDSQNESIAANTRFKTWEDMLKAALAKMPATKFSDSGEFTMFQDGPGRNVLIWNDPTTDEPMVFVFDYFEDGNGPQYHLYNAFVGQDYGSNVENIEQLRGVPPKHGKGSSTDAMFAIKNPAHAEQFTQAEMERQDWADRTSKGTKPLPTKDSSTASSMPVDQAKADAKKVKVGKDRNPVPKNWVHFLGKVFDHMATAIDNMFKPEAARKKVLQGRFRQKYIDEFNPAVRQDLRLEDVDGESLYLNIEAQSEAAYRFLHRAADMFNGVSDFGFIQYFRSDPKSMARGVYTPVALDMTNDSGEVWVYDEDSGRRFKAKFNSNLYNEGKKNTQGGIRTILESLSKGDRSLVPELFRYARAIRAMQLQDKDAPGGPRDAGMTDEEINSHLAFAAKNPEILVAYRNMQNWNEKLIDFAYDTGLITEQEGQFMKETDYTPFYLDLDSAANAHLRAAWEDQKARFKGSGKVTTMRDYDVFRNFVGMGSKSDQDIDIEERLIDGVEATIRNSMGIITSGARNVALYRTIVNSMEEGTARPRSEAKRPDDGSFVKVKVNGVEQEFEIDDDLMFEMMTGVDEIPLFQAVLNSPAMRAFGTFPAQILRQTVTKTPDFILPNVMRDSLDLYMINGGDPKILREVWRRIYENTRAAAGKGEFRKEYTILGRHGATNGYDSIRSSHRVKGQADALKLAAGIPLEKKTLEERLSQSGIWNFLSDLSGASESASREEAYAHVYKRTFDKLKKQGRSDEEADIVAQSEAAYQAVEVLNFNRRGNSQGLRIFTAMAPFVNARIQGIDKLARAGMKIAPVGYDRLDADTVFKNLVNRGKWMAAGSAALAMLNFGDDEYERENGYRRDDHWYMPIPGTSHFVTYPIPFELGTLFKTVPEQLTRAVLLTATGEAGRGGRDALRSGMHVVTTNFGIGSFIPVSARPWIEWARNENLHTGIPIDPYWEQNLAAADRFGPRNTVAARLLGEVTGPTLGLSPRFIDNLIGTVGGGLATMMWGFLDHMARAPGLVSDEWYAPPRPAPSARDIVLLRRLLSSPATATGFEQEYYEWKRELDRIYNLATDAQGSARARLQEKYKDELQARAKLKSVDRQMRRLRDRRKELLENREFMGPISLKAELDKLRAQGRDPINRYRGIRREYDQS